MSTVLDDSFLLAADSGTSPEQDEAIKRAFDICVAAVLLIPGLPIILVAALAIWLVDGGPVLFPQERVGRGGVPFRCLKLRTMRQDADRQLEDLLATSPAARAEWEATRKLRNDPRILGWAGKILRTSSLDELPQFFNVLFGEMSIVGPRPVVREELAHYRESSARLLSVRPGITGLWQVSGRSDTSYANRVRLDLQYIRQWNVWLDVSILFRTLPNVLAGRGAC